MSDAMFKILVDLADEVCKKLSDPHINSYTKWKYKRFQMLCNFLLDEYSI